MAPATPAPSPRPVSAGSARGFLGAISPGSLSSWSRLHIQRYICAAFTTYFRQISSKGTPVCHSGRELSISDRHSTGAVGHDPFEQVSLLCPFIPPRLYDLSTIYVGHNRFRYKGFSNVLKRQILLLLRWFLGSLPDDCCALCFSARPLSGVGSMISP